MALYDFLCGSCGHEFEQRADFLTRTVDCPHCETNTADRLPSLASYTGNCGSGSTRPRKTASNTGKTVFTGNKPDKDTE